MAFEYDSRQVLRERALADLKLELAPRNRCRDYVHESDSKAFLIPKSEFDKLYRRKRFVEGPFKDSFGDADMEPYNPNRQAFGKLVSGFVVYCELSEANQEKLEKLITLSKDK